MLKLESQSQDTYKSYQQVSVLDRKNAKNYQQLLQPQDFLYQEINRILIAYQSGIHQLSTGQKINATKLTLRGGGAELIKSAISVTVDSGHKDSKKYYYQVPQGKRVVKYEERLEGRLEDREKIICSLTKGEGKIAQKDLKDWERSGKGEVKFNVGGMIPAVDVGARGAAKAKDEKEHEEEYSNPTVILEIKAKKPGFFQSMKPVTIHVDVWVEDIPEKREICEKELSARIQGGSAGGDARAEAGSQPAAQEHIDKIRKISAEVINVEAQKDLLANADIPLAINPEQMKDRVDIGGLRSEIDRIKADIKELQETEEKVIDKLENAKTERIQEIYSKKLDEVGGELKELKTRKKELERQIDDLLKREGKEEEKK